MLHHVSLGTNDLARATRFYDAVLPAIGLRRMKEDELAAHYGGATLIFSTIMPADGKPASVGNGTHVAFAAEDRDMVRAFHQAALATGGSCDGPPGVRGEYDAHYYAAFVRDPDGNKLEIVTFSAE